MKRVAIYVRVSSQEQKLHGLSVDNQVATCKRFCKENGYEVVNIYNDAGISARKTYKKRPALLQLIEDCQQGNVDLIIFTKLDRFFRSVPDYYACMEQLNNVPWRAIEEDYETETSSGVFKVNIMLSVAQSEADRTSERVKSICNYRIANGEFCGRPPTGYIKKDGHLYKDENTRAAVEAFFKTYIETHSTYKAMEVSMELGVPMSLVTANRMISSPIYYGGHAHKCEPYITKEEHDFIEQRKHTKTRRPKTTTYLFSGLLRCQYCGRAMRCSNSKSYRKDGTFALTKNYKCTGKDTSIKHKAYVSINEKKLESMLLDMLEDEIGKYNFNVKAENETITNSEATKRKKALEAKLERIGIRFELGDISADEYKAKREAIKDEISSITFDRLKTPIDMPHSWLKMYLELDEEHKKAFWRKLIYKVELASKGEGYNPKITFNNFWLYISDDDLFDN